MKLHKEFDPRDPLEKLAWRELVVVAEVYGVEGVQAGMPDELMRHLLKQAGVHSIPTPRRKLDAIGGRRLNLKAFRDGLLRHKNGGKVMFDESLDEPKEEKALTPLELAKIEWERVKANRGSSSDERERIDSLTFPQLRKECGSRGIPYSRKDTKEALRYRLYPKDDAA